MAFQSQLIFINDSEPGADRLIVGNAVGIKAFYDLFNTIRDLYFFLLHYTEIFNDDQGRCRGYKRYLVDLIGFEKPVADLYDPLFTIFIAVKVGPKEDLVVEFIKIQDFNYLENTVGRNMIDDGTILNC